MAKFNQIHRSGYLPDLIASEILSRVTSGALRPNDRLPPEQELAESFGVSRNVVREAIARLRSDGVIDTKPGRGAVVLPPDARATFRVDMTQLAKGECLESLFELRALLEIDAAGISANRRTADDITAMQQAIDEMTGQHEFDEQRLEADAKFHRAIGASTQNDYLASIIGYISGRLKETTRATGKVYEKDDLLEVTIQEHQRVLDAIEQQDSDAAQAAMANHIKGAASRLSVAFKINDVFQTE